MSILRRIGIWLGLIEPPPQQIVCSYEVEFDGALFQAQFRDLIAAIRLQSSAEKFAEVVLDALQNG